MKGIVAILAFLLVGVPVSRARGDISYHQLPVVVTRYMADSALRVLDDEIKQRPKRMSEKEFQIAQTKKMLARVTDDEAKFMLCGDLFDQYSHYQSDSAYIYASMMLDIAHKLDDPARIAQAQSKFLTFAGPVGLFNEGLHRMDMVDVNALSPREKAQYYMSCSFLYENMSAVVEGNDSLRSRYEHQRDDYLAKALKTEGRGSPMGEFVEFKNKLTKSPPGDARIKICQNYINTHALNDQGLAVLYYLLGDAYRDVGDAVAAQYYYALSAICDLRTSNNETMAATTLAGLMLDNGDPTRADRYIRLSLDEADFYNSMLRKGQITPEFNRIQGMRQHTLTNDRRVAYLLLLVILLLLVVVVLQALKLRRRNRLLVTHSDLTQAKAQEIGDAYDALQIYTDRLEESADVKNRTILDALFESQLFLGDVDNTMKKIEIKAKARQTDDIVRLARGLSTKDEGARLRATFDTIFLSIFPDFLVQVNQLLKADGQLQMTPDGNLPTEARIFALMRMGINEASLQARYLNVSLNTIYVYKARVKAQALVDKEAFDQAIMAIRPHNG